MFYEQSYLFGGMKMSSGMNMGDVLVTLFLIGFFIIIVFIVVWLFLSNKKRNNQLDRVEQKIDELNKQVKKQ